MRKNVILIVITLLFLLFITGTVNAVDTPVTIYFSGNVEYHNSGTSTWSIFSEPTMNLPPGTYQFRFGDGNHNGIEKEIVVSTTAIKKVVNYLSLKNHIGNPLAGGTARGGYGTAFGTWFVSGSTDAYGGVLDIRDASTQPTTISYEMKYNNVVQVKTQDVSANSFFDYQTILLTLRLETCGRTALNTGTVSCRVGTTGSTWWFPGGTTGSSAAGETAAEFFPGTYSFGMNYKGTEQAKTAVLIPNADTKLTWQTTLLTLWYSGAISYGGTLGQSASFTKPSMELLPAGSIKFHFQNPEGGRADLSWNGCTIEKTIASAKVVTSDGTTVQPGATVQWWDDGGTSSNAPGITDATGLLPVIIDGKHTAVSVNAIFGGLTGTPVFKNPTLDSVYMIKLDKPLCSDTDADGICDVDDNCPAHMNADQLDTDGDGKGDVCDGCPIDPSKTETGVCGCGIADTDSDSDGIPDCNDACTSDPLKTAPGTCGCGIADTDSDSDGTPNCNDKCPDNPDKTVAGTCGCALADTDSDSDGIPDCNDACISDPLKTAPGTCGCGVADTDSDSDGILDCNDACISDPLKTAPGTCGCGVADTDSDSDGIPDCNDACPSDSAKIAAGICGCGVADTDSDSDGIPDCNDACPSDSAKIDAGICGCGIADTDSDGDGIEDCNDKCPLGKGTSQYKGCAAAIAIQADIHTIGGGSHPGSVKTPYEELDVKIYDKSLGTCFTGTGVSWQNYGKIYESCTPIRRDYTDAAGKVMFYLMPGDYLIIGDDGSDKHLGVSAGGLTSGSVMQKYLQQIIKADGKKVPAKSTVKTGSQLLIIEPEYVEWNNATELYPIVFDSIGDWGVVAVVTPPEGFVSDYNALTETVNSEVTAVQFTITDVGSDWVPTEMEYTVTHKGKTEKVKTKIGVAMSKKMAIQKGLDTKEKRNKKGFGDLVVIG